MTTKTGLAEAWPRAIRHLRQAIAQTDGTHTEKDIFAGVHAGALQLWVGNRSAGITETVHYPQCKAIRIFLAGGDLAEMKFMGERLEEGARKLGFDRIEIGGRRGFLRALDGYRELCTTMVKDL